MKNSIEEDIELLQNETSSLGLFFKCKGSEKYKIALEHILSDYKRVLKENEELKSKNKTLEELLQGNLYELYKYYKELAGTYQGNCIPVQKVKDKIEHYQKLQDNYIEKYDEINEGLQAMINALQELLEGRK